MGEHSESFGWDFQVQSSLYLFCHDFSHLFSTGWTPRNWCMMSVHQSVYFMSLSRCRMAARSFVRRWWKDSDWALLPTWKKLVLEQDMTLRYFRFQNVVFCGSVGCNKNHPKIWPTYNISPTEILLKEGDFPSSATFWGPRSCEVAEIIWPGFNLKTDDTAFWIG